MEDITGIPSDHVFTNRIPVDNTEFFMISKEMADNIFNSEQLASIIRTPASEDMLRSVREVILHNQLPVRCSKFRLQSNTNSSGFVLIKETTKSQQLTALESTDFVSEYRQVNELKFDSTLICLLLYALELCMQITYLIVSFVCNRYSSTPRCHRTDPSCDATVAATSKSV